MSPQPEPLIIEAVDESDEVLDAAGWAAKFEDWAKATRGTAIKQRTKGDTFGEQLALTRAETYDRAAVLVQAYPLDEAVAMMMAQARLASIRTPPLIDFDQAAMSYKAARAWQFCAKAIDPSVAEVQKAWD
jgi:hypothetical protein